MTNRDQLINNYLSQQLTPEQETEFKKLMEIDSTFREEIDFYENSIKFIQHSEEKKIRSLVKNEFKKPIVENKQRKNIRFFQKHRRSIYTIAGIAATILFLVFFYYHSPSHQPSSYLEIANNFDEGFHNNILSSKNGEPSDTIFPILNNAIHLSIQDSCDISLPILESIFSSNKFGHIAYFYAGLCTRVKTPDKALEYFYEASKSNSTIQKLTNWYFAYTYLRIDKPNPDSTNFYLTKIINDPTYRQPERDKAERFLDQVKNYK